MTKKNQSKYLSAQSRILVVSFLVWVLSAAGFITEAQNTDPYKNMTVDSIYQYLRGNSTVYEYDEEDVYFMNKGLKLIATLTIPKTVKLSPIVITLNGFTGDRNDIVVPGTDGEHYYQRLARIMAERGIATLRIDFRGSGDSEGTFDITSFSSQISDTIAAMNYIERELRGKVNINQIGLFGYSQGAVVGSVTAARDYRVDSIALWSAVAFPPHTYEGLLLKDGIKSGLSLQHGQSGTFGFYVEGVYYYDVILGKEFFEDLFRIDPLAEIRNFKKPMLAVCGKNDIIVWPQPLTSQSFMNYHDGKEKLVVLDADHSMNGFFGSEKLDDAIYWTTAWFINTLR